MLFKNVVFLSTELHHISSAYLKLNVLFFKSFFSIVVKNEPQVLTWITCPLKHGLTVILWTPDNTNLTGKQCQLRPLNTFLCSWHGVGVFCPFMQYILYGLSLSVQLQNRV